MKYVTASGSQTISTGADSILVQINKALTSETITLAAGGTTFAVITGAAAAGAQFRYGGLRKLGAITINPSGTVDVTVSFLNRTI